LIEETLFEKELRSSAAFAIDRSFLATNDLAFQEPTFSRAATEPAALHKSGEE
jgi:hypothetical protein